MDAHALLSEERGALRDIHVELLIVDERQSIEHVGTRRDVAVEIVIELPESREHTERHVELAFRPLTGLTGHAEDVEHIAADRNRLLTGRTIELLDLTALFPYAHQRIEPIELVEGCLKCGECRGAVARPRR